jgi:hypothetical protein
MWTLPVRVGVRREPGLDEDDSAGREVVAHARERGRDVGGLDQISDRAEQALHDVVVLAERERAHVRCVKCAAALAARDGGEGRLDIDAVDRVGGREVSRVLAGAAGDVEERSSAGSLGLDHGAKLRGLTGVVLEGVDRVVELGGGGEHAPRYTVVAIAALTYG